MTHAEKVEGEANALLCVFLSRRSSRIDSL